MAIRMKLLGLFLFLSLLVGCGFTTERTEASDIADTYRTGSQGLVMNFVQNFPPDRVFDTEVDDPNSFVIMLEVSNDGAFNVLPSLSNFYISGYDDNIIINMRGIDASGAPSPGGGRTAGPATEKATHLEDELEGKSYLNPDGETDYIDFKGQSILLRSKNIEIYDPTLLVTACYSYQTLASAQICIDPKPFSTASREKVCIPSAVSLGSQGAPIAVSDVNVEARPGRTRLTLTIQNVGGGDVFKEDSESMNKCNPTHTDGLTFNELDYIKPIVKIGDNVLTCKPVDSSGYIRLNNGQAVIVCEHDTSGSGSTPFTSPLTVQIDYNYRDSVAKRVEIIQSLE